LFTPKIAHLHCHPAVPGTAIDAIEVTITPGTGGGIVLRYCLPGRPDSLMLPPPCPPGPADNLWQHTCCELFVATGDDKRYREFNFSPSSLWAVYDFSDCRKRDTGYTPPDAPRITMQYMADRVELTAELGPALLPAGNTLQLGLSAVIEAADGSKSYWALAHCAAQPDFHLRQSFTLTLNRNTP
jgi:hypothetical protein